MAARTVKLGFVVYTNVDGRPETGYLGDEVNVHKDDLERFDRLNKVPDVVQVAAAAPTQTDIDEAVNIATAEKDAEIEALRAELKKSQDELTAASSAKAAPAAKVAPATKPQS